MRDDVLRLVEQERYGLPVELVRDRLLLNGHSAADIDAAVLALGGERLITLHTVAPCTSLAEGGIPCVMDGMQRVVWRVGRR